MKFESLKSRAAAAVVACATVLLVAQCASVSAATAPKKGGIVTFAEQPGGNPNYILPLTSGAYAENCNLYQFQNLSYLPLYWFGHKGLPVLNEALSVAYPPVFSDNNTVVNVTLKHWVWSDGAPITARDVIFWMNLLSAVTDPEAPIVGTTTAPGPGYVGEVPGGFPQNVVSYAASGTYTVVFKLNRSYNSTWFLYDELSQVFPLPQTVWDELSANGPVGNYDLSAQTRAAAPASDGLPANSYLPTDPGSSTAGALGVAQFLNSQSQDLSTYARNPLWQMVDGPFTLTQFTTDGFAKFEPNKDYSGAPKPTISAFEELPFTTDAAEFNAVESGSVTIGYIPIPDLKQAASVDSAEGYRVSPWYAYGFNYVAYNFTDPTLGPIFSQLYFRQAAQSLINQPEYIKDFLDGYGLVTNGAVPAFPKDNPFESPLVEKGVVYPYDPSKAVSLLRANGWTVVPGGTSYCARAGGAAGDCGSGIKKGQELKVPVLVGSGNTALMDEMDAMQSTMASKAGIDLELSQEPISDIVSVEYNNCTFASPCPDWAMTASSTYPSWTYSPFFLPTGETLFETGAASNLGDYSNPVDDANIRATNTTVNSKAETAAIFKYENYLAEQLPHAWIPCAPWQVTVYKKTLSGVVPQDASVIIYPQQYRVGGA